ncbi:hypothetical protein PAMA_018829 [Pampus argenteus]
MLQLKLQEEAARRLQKFPKDKELRKKWETAVRREGFSASPSSVLCSEHFRPEDFDRTGQTVRIRAGAVPSVFCYPAHLHRPVVNRTSQTSKKAQDTLSLDCSELVQEAKPLPNDDHSYALPSSHDDLRAKLREALARATDDEETFTRGMKVGVVMVKDGEDIIDTAVVLEEAMIMPNLHDFPHAIALLMGILFSLNIDYPKELRLLRKTI